MSIEDLRQQKIKAIKDLLQQCQEFSFTERLKDSFRQESELPTFDSSDDSERNEQKGLEPLIIIRDSIQPILTKKKMDQDMTKVTAANNTQKQEEADLEDLTDLLGSVNNFSSTSSQIPQDRKASVLQNIIHLSMLNLQNAIKSIDFKVWQVETVADLLDEIIKADSIPIGNTSLLVHAAVYPKIIELNSSAPRLLMNTIVALGKHEGRCVLDGLIMPLLFEQVLSRPKTEVILKVVNESLNQAQRLFLLQVIISDGETYFSNNTNVIQINRKYLRPWNDTVFQIMNSILTTHPLLILNNEILFDIIQPIQTFVQADPKNKGSMQLLLVLTSKYAQYLVEFKAVDIIEEICKISNMFLKRSVMGQITSIKKKLASS